MGYRTEWYGDDLSRDLSARCVQAVDTVTKDAVPVAQSLVHVDTGLLQSRITNEPATASGGVVTGAIGVFDDPGYALPQELLPPPRGKAYIRPAGDGAVRRLPDVLAGNGGQQP